MNANAVFLSTCENIGDKGLLERISKTDVINGIQNTKEIINTVSNMKCESEPLLGDDFIPNTALYNTLGAIYPLLTRELKDEVIAAYLRKMDGVNYYYVQINHTAYIREPLALTDLLVARWIYFPGLEEYGSLIKEHPGFDSFKEKFMQSDGLFIPEKVKSDFLMAYAILRKDCSNFGSDYAKAAHPEFLNRVIQGLTGVFAGGFDNPDEENKYIKSLKDLLPPELHLRIDEHYAKRDWADRKKFNLR